MHLLNRYKTSLFFVLFCWIFASQLKAQLSKATAFQMVQNGKAQAVIIEPSNASPEEHLAATELSDYVFKITGAHISVSNLNIGNNKAVYIGRACPNYAVLIKVCVACSLLFTAVTTTDVVSII